MDRVRNRLVLVSLLAAAILPYFVGLGDAAIWDANEAFYVETPREMIERGDYVFPTFNYEPRVNKPILSYWIVAGFYKVLGISVWSQRLAIALGGVGLVAIAFFLGRAALSTPESRVPNLEVRVPHVEPQTLIGDPRGRGATALVAGLWAAVGLAIAPRVLMFSRRIFIDIYISLFMALTLLFFALSERYPERRRLWLVSMYVAAALGVLTKGPIALVIPALVFGLYLLIHRELGRIAEMMLPLGALIVIAIVAPWYVALYQRSGWTDIVSFVVGENIVRFTEGIGASQNARGWWFYVPIVFSDSFPWSLFLPAAFLAARHRRADAGSRVRMLMFLWIAGFVALFSFSATKQDLYIFPIVPAIAALAGWVIAAGGPGIRWTAGIVSALFAAFGGGALFLFGSAGAVYALEGTIPVAAVAIAGGVLSFTLVTLGRTHVALIAVVVTVLVLNWTFILRVLPSFERYKPAPALSEMLLERAAPDDLVIHYSIAMPSMVYYMRRHIEVIYNEGLFLEAMRAPKRIFAVLWASDYGRLEPWLPVRTCVIRSAPLFNIKAGAVLKREPLRELVVITNRCAPK